MRKNSIIFKLIVIMLSTVIFQSAIFVGAIVSFKSFERIDENSMDVFNEQVIAQKTYILNEMLQRWGNLEYDYEMINQIIQESNTDKTIKEVISNKADVTNLLLDIAAELLILIRKNAVNGVFIVLDDGNDRKPSLWIRDYEPTANPGDYSDLTLIAGNNALCTALQIPLDSAWQAMLSIDEQDNYYHKPMAAVAGNEIEDIFDYAYWSSDSRISEDDIKNVTYTVPLLDENNAPIGVMGIEISQDYIIKVLGRDALYGNDGTFMLAYVDQEAEIIASGNSNLVSYIKQSNELHVDDQVYKTIYKMYGDNEQLLYGSVQSLQLYNNNTPFVQEQWLLIGAVRPSRLFTLSNNIKGIITLSIILSVFIAFLGAMVLANFFVLPIKRLNNMVRNMDTNKDVQLQRVNVKEIDELSYAIEVMSVNIAQSSSRMSRIISMVDDRIGAFDFSLNNIVMCSPQIYEILELQEGSFDSYSAFVNLLKFKGINISNTENSFSFTTMNDEQRYVSIKQVEKDGHIIGVIKDVTKEMIDQKRLEYDRDHDLLTNLYNRRAFVKMVSKRFENREAAKIGACVFIDLDNLKYINDSYGHDYGDLYLKSAASVMNSISSDRVIVARMSGDEFYICCVGFDTKDEIRELLNKMWNNMKNTKVKMADNTVRNIEASAGVAWYPDDSADFKKLLTFSDFAMYRVKKSKKGVISEFDASTYTSASKNALIKKDLKEILYKRNVKYAFQAIIDVKSGEVFGYEALMRVDTAFIRTPLELLDSAKQFNLLDDVERLTMFEACRSFKDANPTNKPYKLFINSLPNHILTSEDVERFEKEYPELLSLIVFEIMEFERADQDFTNHKMNYFVKWHSEMAIDDFGTGYSNDAMVLNYHPNYLKLDISLISNIANDSQRYTIVRNIINIAKDLNIKTIAEGVEKFEDIKALVEIGVDYLQGFYYGKPIGELYELDEDKKLELQAIYTTMINKI